MLIEAIREVGARRGESRWARVPLFLHLRAVRAQ
jgi:hypothetical protein